MSESNPSAGQANPKGAVDAGDAGPRGREATIAGLRPFFEARSVAVVGASRDPAAIGHRILAELLEAGFAGSIYPVNPKADELLGLAAHESVAALPEAPDLAVIAVPAPAVSAVVDECAARGTKAVVVISAGFAETGADGRLRQDALLRQVRGHGMRMVGPNCLGIISTAPDVRMNASFSTIYPPAGSLAMASQSGALGIVILALARSRGLGLSSFVSLGNKADVSSNDLIQYWAQDGRTRVILLYLESFGNPRRFAVLAPRIGRRVPIVAVKSGRTKAGQRAAGSHTAALAASDVAVNALFRQTGVLRADSVDDMFHVAAALDAQPLPRGRRVGIITNAGGPGIMCADACQSFGLTVPALPPEVRAELGFLSAAASTANPVDMIASASPEDYRRSIEVVLGSGAIDGLVVIYIPVGTTPSGRVAEAIGQAVAAARSRFAPRAGSGTEPGRGAEARTEFGEGVPVLACMMAGDTAGEPQPLPAGDERIPAYAFPEAAALALGRMVQYAEWRRQPEGEVPSYPDLRPAVAGEVVSAALRERGAGWLSAGESRRVLEAFGVRLLPGGVAATAEEAVAIAERCGYPVAVKAASLTLVHKTEFGGVRLGIAGPDELREAVESMRARVAAMGALDGLEGFVVQPMVEDGVEVLIGMTGDPLFGPLVAFGLGGIHVEVLGDVAFRVTPLTDRDADEMIRSIKGFTLLEGYRGHPAADVGALAEMLLRVSQLVDAVPEIAELDLNPVFARVDGAWVSDARVRVEPGRSGGGP